MDVTTKTAKIKKKVILHCTTLTFWRCIAEYYHVLFYFCSFSCDIRIVNLTRRCKRLVFAFYTNKEVLRKVYEDRQILNSIRQRKH